MSRWLYESVSTLSIEETSRYKKKLNRNTDRTDGIKDYKFILNVSMYDKCKCKDVRKEEK